MFAVNLTTASEKFVPQLVSKEKLNPGRRRVNTFESFELQNFVIIINNINKT